VPRRIIAHHVSLYKGLLFFAGLPDMHVYESI
jgi:hypothetical protein